MRIALLGGSFNPPHIGHILVTQQLLDFAEFDEVWWVPAYQHSFDKPLASFSDRLAMLKLLDTDKTHICTAEADYKLDGNTINLIPHLREKYPDADFSFVIGSDQLPTFTKWGSWEKLLDMVPFLVVPRAGYPMSPLQSAMKAFSHDLFITTNISSSMVRARIGKKLSIQHLVTPEVAGYIVKNGLYR